MQMVRYRNVSPHSGVIHRVALNGERFEANAEMGFIELPAGPIGDDYARSLGLEAMEGLPTVPLAMADPRIIQRHADVVGDFEERLADLQERIRVLGEENARLTAERDQAMKDKAQLLVNYDQAIARLDEMQARLTAAQASPDDAKGAPKK